MPDETPVSDPYPDLIHRYATAGEIQNLLTLFDAQRRQMQRAEDLSRAYQAQMLRQAAEIAQLRGTDSKSSVPIPEARPKVQAKPTTMAAPVQSQSKKSPALIDVEI